MIFKIIVICLLAVIGHHVWKLVMILMPSTYPHPHAPGPCHKVPGIDRGAEDFFVLKNGLVLVSAGLFDFGMHELSVTEQHPGRLLLLDPNNDHIIELKLADKFKTKWLNPHGITVWQDDKSDTVTVFVINHQPEGEAVEKFHLDLKTNDLTLVQTIQHPSFTSLNNLVATSHETFYTTLDLGPESLFLRKVCAYLLIRVGAVLYYDGTKVNVVVDNLLYPNGIALSNDGRHVYVSEIGKKSVHVYERDVATNRLKLVQMWHAYTGLDNILLDEAGNIWLAAQPSAYETLLHLHNKNIPSPSQVLKLSTKNGRITSMHEVFSDDGKLIYAASSAVVYGTKLLIGSVRHDMLICDVMFDSKP